MLKQNIDTFSANELAEELTRKGKHLIYTSDANESIKFLENLLEHNLPIVDYNDLIDNNNEVSESKILLIKITQALFENADFYKLNIVSNSFDSSIILLVVFEKCNYLTYCNELPEIKKEYLTQCLKYCFGSMSIIEKLAYRLDNEEVVQPLVVRTTNFKVLKTQIGWFYNVNEKYVLKNFGLGGIVSEYNSNAPVHSFHSNRFHYIKRLRNKIGIDEFDNEYNGFHLGELVVIGGRTGMGKTTFAMNLALQLQKRYPVCYFSLAKDNIKNNILYAKFISILSDIEYSSIINGDLFDGSPLIVSAHAEFSSLDISFPKIDKMEYYELENTLKTYIDAYNSKIIIIDDLQSFINEIGNNRIETTDVFCNNLKNIALKFNVLIILLSQLSQEVDIRCGDKKPQIIDLKDTNHLEEYADKVLLLYRPNYYKIWEDENGNPVKDIMELIVAKNNFGKTGKITLQHNPSFTKFSEIIANKNEKTTKLISDLNPDYDDY